MVCNNTCILVLTKLELTYLLHPLEKAAMHAKNYRPLIFSDLIQTSNFHGFENEKEHHESLML